MKDFNSRLEKIEQRLKEIPGVNVIMVEAYSGETQAEALKKYNVKLNDINVFIHVKSDEQIQGELKYIDE